MTRAMALARAGVRRGAGRSRTASTGWRGGSASSIRRGTRSTSSGARSSRPSTRSCSSSASSSSGYANAWPRVWAIFGIVNALALVFFVGLGHPRGASASGSSGIRRPAPAPAAGAEGPADPLESRSPDVPSRSTAPRMTASLRVVFFGTPEFAVPSLDALARRRASPCRSSSRSPTGPSAATRELRPSAVARVRGRARASRSRSRDGAGQRAAVRGARGGAARRDRRRRLRPHPPARHPASAAPRLRQRARVAAAAAPRRLARPGGDSRRRRRDRRGRRCGWRRASTPGPIYLERRVRDRRAGDGGRALGAAGRDRRRAARRDAAGARGRAALRAAAGRGGLVLPADPARGRRRGLDPLRGGALAAAARVHAVARASTRSSAPSASRSSRPCP